VQGKTLIAQYHTHKYLDDSFHSKSLGGDKRSIFPKKQLSIVHKAMVEFLSTKPEASRQDLLEYLCQV
jgi:hypothetical protein